MLKRYIMILSLAALSLNACSQLEKLADKIPFLTPKKITQDKPEKKSSSLEKKKAPEKTLVNPKKPVTKKSTTPPPPTQPKEKEIETNEDQPQEIEVVQQNEPESIELKEPKKQPSQAIQPSQIEAKNQAPVKKAIEFDPKPKKLEQTVGASKNDSQIPIRMKSSFLGQLTSLDADENYIYLGYPQRLVIYTRDFTYLSEIEVEAKVLKVDAVKVGDSLRLFIHEEGNVLELVKLSPQSPLPQREKTFFMDNIYQGPFTTADGQTQIFIFLKDKIQVLDMSQPDKVQIFFELPLANAQKALLGKKALYVFQENQLHIYDALNFSRKASTPITSTPLGFFPSENPQYLITAQKNLSDGKWKGLTLYHLHPETGLIQGQGEDIKWDQMVDQLSYDAPSGTVIGWTSQMWMEFSLELRETKIKKDFSEKQLPLKFVVKNREELIWSNSRRISKSPSDEAANPEINLATDIRYLKIIGKESMLIGNQTPFGQDTKDSFAWIRSWNQKPSWALNIKAPLVGATHLTYSQITAWGALAAFDNSQYNNQKALLLFKGEKRVKEIPLWKTIKNNQVSLRGFDFHKQDNTLFLIASTEKGIHILSTKDLKNFKEQAELKLPEARGLLLFNQGQTALVACEEKGVCLLDLSLAYVDSRPVIKLEGQILIHTKEEKVVDLRYFPFIKLGFAFIESNQGNSIAILRIKKDNITRLATLPNIPMDAQQFQGISFSHGGTRLLIPQNNGLGVYNIQIPYKPSRLFLWPSGKVYGADITNAGKTVCLALGIHGIQCGDFVK